MSAPDLAALLDRLRGDILHCHQVLFNVYNQLREARLSSDDWWTAATAMAKLEMQIEKEIDRGGFPSKRICIEKQFSVPGPGEGA